jgi:predicted DNA-binding transcriptional regulator YafY
MAIPKLERLLNLTALLLETPRPLSAREIQARMGEDAYPAELDQFRRAFERDKAELRAMGVPIDTADVPGAVPAVEGYRIPKDEYYLRDPGLSADELSALRLAASLVQLDGVEAREGLLKLGGLVGGDDEHQDAAMAVQSLPGADVAPLFGAIASRRSVRFGYRGEERTLDPYRLHFAKGRWYLNGYDHARGEERVFRLDRFESAAEVLPGTSFDRPASAGTEVQLDPWVLGDGDPVEARVLVDAPQAPWIVQHLGPASVAEEREDGSVVVTMLVTNRDNFRSFVLTFLDHAEVLDPPEMRELVVSWLQEQAA